ncbi:uncharacterized protein LOC117314832 [Pecten maximus]|uniref:uncharacterized protein LOC117314832 n=1 Tax=Pecten maximus TaxID=6579 RepID=UPI001458B8FA|nr:uncharacterized protein LOC117314832 [Pecten maximus]
MRNDTDPNGELRDAVLCFKDTGLQLIAGDLINVTCAEQIEGRYLRILKRRSPILTLCEVLVTGVPVGDQTTNEDTTSTSTTEAAPSDHFNTTCHSCQCHNTNASLKYMNKSIENLILELQEKLLVHKKATSSFKRKLLSARDGRLSSQVIGSAGLLILVLVCMVIVLPDLVTFIRFVRLRLRKTE